MTRPATDSRHYIVAFELRSVADCPLDFALPDSLAGFDAGLFLPRDDPDRLGLSSYPPRILLLQGGALAIVAHPSAGEQTHRWAMAQISAVESGHMLLKGWLRFSGAAFDCTVRYNTRGCPSVDRFMARFRSDYLRITQPRDAHEAHPGERLDIKFANALDAERDCGEAVYLQFFQPPEERASKRWWFPQPRCAAGDLLALTDRRLLWITDRENGFRSRYGTIASYAPLDAVSDVALVPGGLQVDLNGSAAWHVPIAPAYRQSVEEFAAAFAKLPKHRLAFR
jgi:hypothetical protein